MELNHLRVFYEVAKVGRFTEAAKKLNISQSALSRSVALLEDSEGVQLFERSKQGVSLTPIGKKVFLQCEELFKTFHAIERTCRGIKETCEGPLRFGSTDHVTNYLLIETLQDFRQKYPLVMPSVFVGTPDNIIQNLLYTDSEFALLFVKIPLPQIEYSILRQERMALVCSPEVWKQHKSSSIQKTLSRVIENEGYIASIGVHMNARPSRVLLELFGELPKIGFESDSQEVQKRVCIAGGGVAYLSYFMVAEEIKNGTLYEIPVENTHQFNFWLATCKGRELSLTARTFIDSLKK